MSTPSNEITFSISPRPPFDDEDADIVFRSSDNVDFRLYRVILAKASPVFRTMLQLPQPPSSTLPGPDKPHVVELTEDGKTLENLLRLCYPVEHPNVASVDEIHDILEVARKYEITNVTANLRWNIMRFIPKEPLRIYAIAYMFHMEDVAKEAANLLLDDPQFHIPPSPPPEFSVLPSLAIYVAHKYRQDCVAAALGALLTERWDSQPAADYIWMTCSESRATHQRLWVDIRAGPIVKAVRIFKWLEVYFNALKTALMERPSGRTVRTFPTSTEASEAFSQTASCSDCASKAHADLTRFSKGLADKVDGAIAQVKIELPF